MISVANAKGKIYGSFGLEAGDLSCLAALEPMTAAYSQAMPKTPDECDAIAHYDESFMLRFVYNSNSIEGSTLSIADTELVLEGEFPAHTENKKLKDAFAALGIRDGMDFAERLREENGCFPLTEAAVKDVHERTALDCQPRTRGVYRTIPVYIRGSRAVPADAMEIRDQMADLLFAFGQSGMGPVAKAAAFHAIFENIHPFQDGNGRTGRIILNAMLEDAGFPPIAIKAGSAALYKESLESWQADGDPKPFLELVCTNLLEEMGERVSVIERVRRACSSGS